MRKKQLYTRFGIFEFLHMSDEAAALHGKDEVARHLPGPSRKCLRCRQAIKTVVDLDRGEMPRIKGKPLALRAGPGIKLTVAPMSVVPSTGADENLSRHVSHKSRPAATPGRLCRHLHCPQPKKGRAQGTYRHVCSETSCAGPCLTVSLASFSLG